MPLSAMKGILQEDVTLGFPVDGAPAHRSPSGGKGRHCPASSAHFSEVGNTEKDTTLCMAILVVMELRELSRRKENGITWKSCHFSKSVPTPLATLPSPSQIHLAPS